MNSVLPVQVLQIVSHNTELLLLILNHPLLFPSPQSSNFSKADRVTTSPIELKTSDDKDAVPPGTEAFVWVVYTNLYSKINEVFKWKYEEAGNIGKAWPSYSSKSGKEWTVRFKAKWSDNCGGSAMYGGWSEYGVAAFELAKLDIAHIREDSDSREQLLVKDRKLIEVLQKKQEDEMIEKLKARHGEDTEEYKKQVAMNKRKKEKEDECKQKKGRKKLRKATLDR